MLSLIILGILVCKTFKQLIMSLFFLYLFMIFTQVYTLSTNNTTVHDLSLSKQMIDDIEWLEKQTQCLEKDFFEIDHWQTINKIYRKWRLSEYYLLKIPKIIEKCYKIIQFADKSTDIVILLYC